MSKICMVKRRSFSTFKMTHNHKNKVLKKNIMIKFTKLFSRLWKNQKNILLKNNKNLKKK